MRQQRNAFRELTIVFASKTSLVDWGDEVEGNGSGDITTFI
jgi:hypothetical protein